MDLPLDGLAAKLKASIAQFSERLKNEQSNTGAGWVDGWLGDLKRMGYDLDSPNDFYCEKKAQKEGATFERFNLVQMRPKAVTARKERGDVNIKDATGHSTERMIDKSYDRRVVKKSDATE